MKPTKKPYNAFSNWLFDRYQCRVKKVSLSASFGCPNRDGTLSRAGCVFCDEHMAGLIPEKVGGRTVGQQLDVQIQWMEKNSKHHFKYLAYLQAGSNTHGDLEKRQAVYETIAAHSQVVGVSIGTRPDCLNAEVLDQIYQVFGPENVWIELGMQSSFDRTLRQINRNHTFADAQSAILLARQYGFFVCAHLILGLPGEDEQDMIKTVEAVNALDLQGVKFHTMSITQGAALEAPWRQGKIELFEQGRYVELVIALLERLDPSIVVHRLVGGGRPEVHLAPAWSITSASTLQMIVRRMNRRKTRQGARFKNNIP